MKKITLPAIISFFFLTAALLPETSVAQKKDSAKIAMIKNCIDSRHYTFKAQVMLPVSGRSRQLTSDYDVRITRDTVISVLPYFGRAYSAPLGTDDNGLRFTSKDFDYTIMPKKKDGWNVKIKIKDVSGSQQMDMSIFSNGTASLQVTGTNREPVSFTGYITTAK